MENLDIRDMKEEDLNRIYEIEKSCFSDYWSKDLILSSFRQNYNFIKVLTFNELIVAYINFNIIGEDAELMSIAVLEEYRNRRYASRLMEAMFKICEENKVEKIFLELRESNLLAYKLYREHGFVNMGIRREYYTNPVENAVLMYKQLTDCAG